ncbi:transporter [Halorubrum trueperi]|uniref:Transporter n=1 Tax=Halorubrum trueperi TaxID=2004704 RepID=A0ABD5UMC6_9EURY
MSVPDRANRTSGIVAGAAAGVAAYLLGYLVTYLTQSGRIEEQLAGFNVFADLFGSDPIPAWQAVGWMFYNAHFVDTAIPSFVGGTRSVNLISQADGGSLSFLFVVPPVLLVVAGLAAGRLAGATEPADGALSGAFVLAGYLPLAVVGAFAFRYAVGDGAVAPDTVTAVLLAGGVYPAVFGAAGGAVSTLLGE